MNDDIRVPEVRCNVDGAESLGIVSIDEAMEKANELGLDLVLIAPDAKPPVAKIMDYGKYKYQEEKKQKEQRKNQVKIDVKEIKLSVKIAENDIAYKVKHAREFLEQGKHVKFRVFLKGREMANPEAAKDVLLRIWPMVEDIAVMEKPPKFEGRYYNMYVIPQK
ncbi:translation initiation factor IF-3 [Sulfurimonas sp. CVO]|jgi:translation initiation factor IF-3|uniref:Translation initiation factor IF-3 n=1 Tax=Sulfurimonas xiamenensis TaxID=2590021 RepID=A0AAJ4A5D4_9BACT|nr:MULTISPECIES: translation initiation factor IF-3 [Sulfurimonas]QFR44253.1 translation initiation factor IF-3 [Sulfurimonas xiamenensis]QHG92090.1 translation initiation factor IF-3 [Sulfurimonas sp. CVO]